ncbi:Glutamate receptor 2 [Nymphon striatum]|nr:Glutamate receptor 2 [Nymphon striatum]
MHPTCWKYLWTILTATTTFQLPVFASGWARRPSQGKSYGRKYIEPFKNDIDDMFMSGIEDKSNKTGPGRMLEQLRLKYSDRLDLPSESEIRQRISSLFAKYKKHGTIEAKRRGIIEFYRQHLGIIKKVMTKARENMWLVSFYPTSRISNSTWTVACFQTYALPLVIVIISDSLDEINELFLKTEKLIVRYVRDVSAMLCFVSAVREKRIERHLAAERVLLPKCFAFGHQNYARYMTFQHVKLQDIKSKQDEAWNDLLVNGFGGSVSGKPYSTIHGDLITETTINREVKVRGGPMQGGFSTDEKAVDTFVKTSHFMATVRVKLKERLNVLTQSVHKETTVGAIKRHKTMIESLVLQLDKYFNPFLEGPARHFKTGAEIEQSFDVHIVHDSNYGMKLNNGSWNGMIGELIDEKADIALGPISMTTERLKVVDFSPAIIHSGLSIVYQKPKLLTFNIQSYFAPFSLNFWYLMTASVLVCWICLHFLRLSCNDVECKVEYHARRNIFTIFAMITMQGIHFEPSKSAIRGVLWVLWIWCIIINVAYTANIFSVLAMSRKSVPFKSLYEFSNQDEYKPLVMKNSAHDAFFRNSSIPWHKKIWKKILERGQESFVNNPEEGRIKLNEEKVAYIGDYLSILMNIDRADIGYLKEIQAEDSPCLAFRKNFMYSSLISNRALSRSELEVSLHEVEACLNSRPLTFVSDEVDAHVPLIPFHFLIGKSTNLQQSEDHQPIEYEMSQIGNQKSKAANSLEILSFLLENIYSNRAVIIYDRFMDMEITKKVMQIMKKNMWLVSFYPTSKNQSKISIHFPLIRKKPNMEVTFLKLKNGVDLNQYQSVLKDVKLRKEIKSEIIKVVTIHDPTYVIIDSKIPIRISGIYADILDCLKQDLETNFDLHIVHDSNYGVKLRNGSWNGMIGELIDEKADIALGPLSMTAERLDVVDFSPEILQSGLSIAGVFGPTVIENSILNGRHYSRCLEGMQLLAEAFQRLLYKEFFAEKNVKPYAQELQIVANLKTAVMKRNVIASQKYLVEFADASSKLVEDLNSFIETQSSVNENFKFWAQFLHMMSIVHNLLRADREGLWEHLDAVQRALYLFAAFDSTNYLQWCFLYLEDMRRLPQIAPSVHENFVRNNFSIKDKPGRFTAVGDDQKLEQSINLLSKCSDGIIGHTKQKQYVAQWDLIYHEMMAVKNLHRQYADVIERSHETFNHHESSQVKTDRKEARVQEMMRFIQEKGSFLSPNTPENLHNFVTKEIMSKDISNDMLNALKRNGRST